MSSQKIKYLTQGAAIAAVYVVVTLLFAPISFGQSGIDVRIAEALTILPLFTPAAVPGLFVGCVIANMLGGGIIWDVIFGSLATLIGAIGCRKLKNHRYLAPIPTVVANTVIVPLVLRFGYGLEMSLPLLALSVGIGELIGAYALGQVLCSALKTSGRYIFGSERKTA